MSRRCRRHKERRRCSVQILDNEDSCKRLIISKYTLKSYRDAGKIPYSMIEHKCYCKERDITGLLNAKISVLLEINAS